MAEPAPGFYANNSTPATGAPLNDLSPVKFGVVSRGSIGVPQNVLHRPIHLWNDKGVGLLPKMENVKIRILDSQGSNVSEFITGTLLNGFLPFYEGKSSGSFGVSDDAQANFVPVGAGSKFQIVSVTPGGANNWICAAASPSLIIKFSIALTMKKSIDGGMTWSFSTPPVGTTIFSALWVSSLSLFVVAGNSGINFRIYTSPDGAVWTQRLNVTGAGTDGGLAWSADISLFVAVSGNLIYTSPDGITWTVRAHPAALHLRDVCWGTSPRLLFVAVGSSALGTGMIITSPDGIIWTSRTSPTPDWNGVDYSPSNDRFAVVGYRFSSSGNVAAYSVNGIVWTLSTSPDTNSQPGHNKFLLDVYWSDEVGLFLTFNNLQDPLIISYNGKDWIEKSAPYPDESSHSGAMVDVAGAGYIVVPGDSISVHLVYGDVPDLGNILSIGDIPPNTRRSLHFRCNVPSDASGGTLAGLIVVDYTFVP